MRTAIDGIVTALNDSYSESLNVTGSLHGYLEQVEHAIDALEGLVSNQHIDTIRDGWALVDAGIAYTAASKIFDAAVIFYINTTDRRSTHD
jgi:hypothetical protein